ncbi:hypothetical protein MMC22_004176 [Lobaria immixta]|nr:hypothetical protein [Lobaria immixta]
MDGVIDGLYDSPLLRAIQHHRQANVELLLRTGADPNGQHIRCMMNYSARIMGRRVGGFNFCSNVPGPPQTEPLLIGHGPPQTTRRATEQEPNRGLTRFWAEPDFPPLPPAAPNTAMTALERAAREGPIEALDAILSKSPDVSFWTSPQPAEMPSLPPHSALSASSLLHAAVEERHTLMLSHLLALGFSPNSIPPLAAESRSSVGNSFNSWFSEANQLLRGKLPVK